MVQGRRSRLGVNGVGVSLCVVPREPLFYFFLFGHTKQLIQKFHKSAAMGISGGIV